MTTINQALGDEIIGGGIEMVSADEAVFGNAADVFLSQGKVFTAIQSIAAKAGADHIRLMLANRLGDLVVGVLHGGDINHVLKRAIAEIARAAPAVELQRQQRVHDDLSRQFSDLVESRIPLKGAPPLQPAAGEAEPV